MQNGLCIFYICVIYIHILTCKIHFGILYFVLTSEGKQGTIKTKNLNWTNSKCIKRLGAIATGMKTTRLVCVGHYTSQSYRDSTFQQRTFEPRCQFHSTATKNTRAEKTTTETVWEMFLEEVGLQMFFQDREGFCKDIYNVFVCVCVDTYRVIEFLH